MRALAIVYEPDAGPGVFADAFAERGFGLDTWFAADGVAPPADPADYDAVLSFGGSMHVDQEDRHPWLATQKRLLAGLLERRVPVLGVCLGAQLLAAAAGSQPRPAREPEIGWYEIEVAPEGAGDPVIGPLAPRFEALQWHSYTSPLPDGAVALATTPDCLQAYRIGDSAWGIQFHAEVTLEDAESWMDEYLSDEDRQPPGVDIDGFRRRTRAEIGEWNELGRGLCGRFLDATRE
jgi:GMP synthase-like glutamine amidotransferase